ncbi:serine hydrolase, partial [Streptomonospora algeriensis]
AGPLDARSRAHLCALMSSVAPEQAWGVSAAADPGESAELKNAWAPVPGRNGPWTVHSTGRIAHGDREYLIAVLTDGQPDYGTGVGAVEDAARLVIGELSGALD